MISFVKFIQGIKTFPAYPSVFYMFVYSWPCERILSVPSVVPYRHARQHWAQMCFNNAQCRGHTQTGLRTTTACFHFSDIFAVLPRTVALVLMFVALVLCCFF